MLWSLLSLAVRSGVLQCFHDFLTWICEQSPIVNNCIFSQFSAMSIAPAAYDRTTLFAQRRKLMQDWADYLFSTAHEVPKRTEDDEFA